MTGQAQVSQGLTFESCGVIVHEDGTVTHICGGGDSPEKAAKVEAENKAEREKEAKQRKKMMERSQEAAEERRRQIETVYKKQSMAEALTNHIINTSRVTYAGAPEVMSSAITAYEMSALTVPDILK